MGGPFTLREAVNKAGWEVVRLQKGQTEVLKLFLMIPPSLGRYSADPRGQSRPSTRGPRPRETYEEIRNALTLLGNQVLSEYRSSTICL